MLLTGIINLVINLKKSTKLFLKTVVISGCCCAVFVGVGYSYLSRNLLQTETETESVPYYRESPQNAGILFDFSGDKTFAYLDFENSRVVVSLNPEPEEDTVYGYPLDFEVEGNVDFVADLVDYLDGIELETENQTLRYTGVQVEELLSVDSGVKSQIVTAIAKKIAQNGLGSDMFLSVIKNCDTNLTVPDFYYWPDYIKNLCANLQIIDN